ncbi:BgtTE-56026 [Blumeria graminis f. sp. tritici]|uniref:BgtTE-56026 n=1 Tax=Blumeria graminis f. sp. tritici TaxID=62690 RepID=A0A9X9PSA4_BLUGR|nr:BgtTE-56026 [Blumeria graminis f. sp. tritici]
MEESSGFFGVVLIFLIFRFCLISCTFGSDSRGWNELGCRKDYRESCRLRLSLTQCGKHSFSLGQNKQTNNLKVSLTLRG